MKTSRLIAAAAILFAVAGPALSSPFAGNCRTRVNVYESQGYLYASTFVESVFGFEVDADVHVRVNGQEVKVEPVMTRTAVVLTTRLAPAGANVTVCTRTLGRNWVTEESWMPADTTSCAFFSGESGSLPQAPSPGLREDLKAPTLRRMPSSLR